MENPAVRMFRCMAPKAWSHTPAPSPRCTPQGIPYTESNCFINKDNQYLFKCVWEPEEDVVPKAIVFISHGIFEHCLAYEETVAKPLNEIGYLVVSHDHIGHGQSEGERAFISNFFDFVRDVIDHVESVLEETNHNLPIFILGHSMGGVIALHAAIQRPDLFRGIILDGVAYQADSDAVSPFLHNVMTFMSRAFPRAPLVKLPLKHHTSDATAVENFRRDPLRYKGKLKAGMAVQYMQAITDLEKQLEKIVTPVLLAHGTDDKLASPEGSQKLYNNIGFFDKEIVLFEGCYHQIHWEPNGKKELFVRTIVDWMAKRLN